MPVTNGNRTPRSRTTTAMAAASVAIQKTIGRVKFMRYSYDWLPKTSGTVEQVTSATDWPLASGASWLRRLGIRLTFGFRPLSRPPKDRRGNRDQDERQQQKKQRRLFKQRDPRDPNSEYQTDEADPPRPNMEPGRKRPERQQGEDSERAGVGIEHTCDVRNEHKMHRQKHRRPMQGLRPHQAQPFISIVDTLPSRDHANNSHQWSKSYPIKRHGGSGDGSISNAEEREHHDQKIRPLSLQQSAWAKAGSSRLKVP